MYILVGSIAVVSLCYMMLPMAYRWGLLDTPTQRKNHAGDIPLIGGIAMYISVITVSLFFITPSIELLFVLIAAALITFVGALDDKYDLNYRARIVVQLFCGLILVYGADIKLSNLGDIAGFGHLELTLLGTPLTIIALIGIINAYNMIDGIDGLAGGLSIITLSGFLLLTNGLISSNIFTILLILIGSLIGYLILNLKLTPSFFPKVFMGDAGSMMLGLIITATMIRYSQDSRALIQPVTCLWLVGLPLIDICSTVVRRIRKGVSPFHPDRTHIHHILMRLGLPAKLTLVCLLTFQFSLVAIGYELESHDVAEWISFTLFLGILVLYTALIHNAFRITKKIRSYNKLQ